jgi:hypothetical protein
LAKKNLMQAEGEAHLLDIGKLEEKLKDKKTRKVKPAKFPVDWRINDYGARAKEDKVYISFRISY